MNNMTYEERKKVYSKLLRILYSFREGEKNLDRNSYAYDLFLQDLEKKLSNIKITSMDASSLLEEVCLYDGAVGNDINLLLDYLINKGALKHISMVIVRCLWCGNIKNLNFLLSRKAPINFRSASIAMGDLLGNLFGRPNSEILDCLFEYGYKLHLNYSTNELIQLEKIFERLLKETKHSLEIKKSKEGKNDSEIS